MVKLLSGSIFTTKWREVLRFKGRLIGCSYYSCSIIHGRDDWWGWAQGWYSEGITWRLYRVAGEFQVKRQVAAGVQGSHTENVENLENLENQQSIFQYWKCPGIWKKIVKCPAKVLEFVLEGESPCIVDRNYRNYFSMYHKFILLFTYFLLTLHLWYDLSFWHIHNQSKQD